MTEEVDFLAGLTPQQRRFVLAYVMSGESAIARAIQAGEEIGVKNPAAYAKKMLRRINIQEAVKQVQREADMPEEEIRASVAELGRISMADFLEVDNLGGARFNLCKAEKRGALKAVKHIELNAAGGVAKLTLHDPLAALKLAARMKGLLIEKHELSGADGEPLRIEVVYADGKD